jgi:hypothetical protein
MVHKQISTICTPKLLDVLNHANAILEYKLWIFVYAPCIWKVLMHHNSSLVYHEPLDEVVHIRIYLLKRVGDRYVINDELF